MSQFVSILQGVDSVTDYVEDKASEADAGKATAALQSIASSSRYASFLCFNQIQLLA